MDIELRNDRIPRNPFDRQFLDMKRSGYHILQNTNVWLAFVGECKGFKQLDHQKSPAGVG